MILPLLIEGGEYNIHMTLISQSKTAESMGFKGKYDLMQCFDCIIGLKRQGSKHDPRSYFSVVDFGEGDISHKPPGAYRPGRSTGRYQYHSNTSQSQCRTQNPPFSGHNRHNDAQDRHDIPTLHFDPESGEYIYQQQRFYDSKMEKAVVELFINNPAISYNAICNHIWGASNGRRIKQTGLPVPYKHPILKC